MKILLIHQNFAALGEPGGTRHHELARYLAEKGHQVTIITSGVSYLTGSGKGDAHSSVENQPGGAVTIRRAYTYAALHRSFLHRVISFISFMLSSFLESLRVRQVDLVWGTSPPIFQGLTAWAVARLKGVPFIFEVRDLWPAFAVAVGVLRSPFLIRLSEGLERFLYRRADCVMANSPGFIAHIQERSGRTPEIIPNAADPRMFDPSARGESFRRQHGLDDKFVALYAGAHGLSNDLGVVLGAARLLQNEKNIAIVLLGDGKEKPALVAQAGRAGLDNLIFVPPLAKTGMPEALAAADACIAILKPIPMYATVYPNKVFDYMAAGRPVVLAIEGVIRDVVEKGLAGIPITPGSAEELADAIRSLAKDPEKARQMGLSGRAYIEKHFDRLALANELEQLFQRVAQSQTRH